MQDQAHTLFNTAKETREAKQTTTRVPLSSSSKILVHDGFWKLLGASTIRGDRGRGDATLERQDVNMPVPRPGTWMANERLWANAVDEPSDSRCKTATSPGLDQKGESAKTYSQLTSEVSHEPKRLSVDMIGRPTDFRSVKNFLQ